MANKPKAIASTDETLPVEIPTPNVSEDLADDAPIVPLLQAPSSILQAAKLRQQKELDDLQTQVDGLAEEFATRAALIVEQGLTHSYQLARQKIGAINLSFFDSGEAPETINFLPSAAVEV